MRYLVRVCLIVVIFSLHTQICSADIDLRLKSQDINYVSISRQILGTYTVLIELFGPSEITLSQITGEHIGEQINVYISDTLIVSYPITYKVKSAIIKVGEYYTISDAVSRAQSILTAMDNSK